MCPAGDAAESHDCLPAAPNTGRRVIWTVNNQLRLGPGLRISAGLCLGSKPSSVKDACPHLTWAQASHRWGQSLDVTDLDKPSEATDAGPTR
jgi:hypothetical protein